MSVFVLEILKSIYLPPDTAKWIIVGPPDSLSHANYRANANAHFDSNLKIEVKLK